MENKQIQLSLSVPLKYVCLVGGGLFGFFWWVFWFLGCFFVLFFLRGGLQCNAPAYTEYQE